MTDVANTRHSTDIAPAVHSQSTDDMLVRIYHDRATGRTVVALDDTATDALDALLCMLDPQAMRYDWGIAPDDVDKVVGIRNALAGALHKHLRTSRGY